MTATATAPQTTALEGAWADADTAKWDPTFSVFGQADVEVRYVVLQKGVGKLDFDPQQHEVGERRVSVEITIVPVIPGRQNVQRDMLAQSREWATIVNPSIKAFGPNWNAQALKGRYVEAQLVPSGRKFASNRELDEHGNPKQVDATTIKFVRVFANEDECAAAATARFGNRQNGQAADRPLPEDPPAVPTNDAAGRATAAKFLEPLWKSCGGDIAQFEKVLANNPPLGRYFTLTSPEVIALVMPATTPADEAEKLPF